MDEAEASQRARRPEAGEEPAGTLEAAPGLARIAAGAWLRTAVWAAESAVTGGLRLTGAALRGESPAKLMGDVQAGLAEGARRILESAGLDGVVPQPQDDDRNEDAHPRDSLRERGAELLERSADVAAQGEVHPAYARIIEQLAPDEARILRLLATDGAQPAVDVRTWRPFGIGSHVVAPGLTMIGRHAGCMHPERVPAYLSNLFRLGLIWFSRDRVRDPSRYQVLEAQPEVVEATRRAGRAQTVRRSIHLTPFGGHFCEFCLPLGDTGEFEALQEAIVGSDAVASGDSVGASGSGAATSDEGINERVPAEG